MALHAVPDIEPALALSEIEAAAQLAQAHREIAATMPLESNLRALALRSATRWDRIGQAVPAVRFKAVCDAGEES